MATPEINMAFPSEKRDTFETVPRQGRFQQCWPGLGVKFEADYSIVDTISTFAVDPTGVQPPTLYSPVRATLGPPYGSIGVYLISMPLLGAQPPCGLRMVVRGGFEAAQEELFVGDFGPQTTNSSGLLVNITSWPQTQYEVWMRAIDNKNTGTQAHQMRVVVGFIFGPYTQGSLIAVPGKRMYTP